MTPPDPKTPAGEALSDARGLIGKLRDWAPPLTAVRKDCLEAADMIEALLATPPATDAAASGAGFVLVPVEPIDEQCDAGVAVDIDSVTDYPFRISFDEAAAVYRAMLAAAPKVASNAGAGLDHLTRAKARADKRAASGEVSIEGSIYEGIEACLVQHGRTIAHVPRYADAVDLAARLATPTDATDGATGASDAAGLREEWDHWYRPLKHGEVINATDEVRRNDGTWATGVCVGQMAPDPAYTSHRVYRRLISGESATATGARATLTEVKRAIDAIVGDLGQVDSDGYYNGVVHESDVEHLNRCLAALTHPSPIESATRADHAQGGGEVERCRALVSAVQDGQFDAIEAVADQWLERAGVQRMSNAIASVLERYAPQEIMDRFREKVTSLMHLAFVEGAAQGVMQVAPLATTTGGDALEQAVRKQIRRAWFDGRETRGRQYDAEAVEAGWDRQVVQALSPARDGAGS